MSLGKFISEELIDQFLDGEMSADELAEFEQRIESDSLLRRRVADVKKVRDDLFRIGDRQRLIERLDAIHEEQLTSLPVYKPERPIRKKRSNGGKKIRLKPFIMVIGAAASIALLVFAGIQYLGGDGFTESSSADLAYEELAKEEDSASEGVFLEEAAEEADISPVVVEKKMTATAFVVAQNGYLVTNNHVVGERIIVKQVNTTDTIEFKAEVALRDTVNDLVLIKINDSEFKIFGVVPFSLSNNDQNIGNPIFTLGYPKNDIVFGDGNISSTSGLGGDLSAYQISIPVNKGNSGCPVFNSKAELVAIVKGKKKGAEGTAFAIKSKHVVDLINQYEEESQITLKTPKRNQLSGKSRSRQIKHITPFVFTIESWK